MGLGNCKGQRCWSHLMYLGDWRSIGERMPINLIHSEKIMVCKNTKFTIVGNSNAFIPFGGGSRGCLGGRFGILEAKLVITRVLQRVELKKHSSWKKLDSILAFTLRPKHPVMADANLK